MVKRYLADTYAFNEEVAGNERYIKIFASCDTRTTLMNVLEFYSGLLRRLRDKPRALQLARSAHQRVVEPPDGVVFVAAEFKRAMNDDGKDCSYIDAWGYAVAKALGVPFLTGDPRFKGVENVEFVT